MNASLVTGIDSSTQSCKVVVCDSESGRVVRRASAPHPEGTEVDPRAWEAALDQALGEAGGLDDDVVALGVAAQQHGLVALDEDGAVVRSALLWNDTRSAGAAADLVAEVGAETWARLTGSVPVASFTVTKLRWLAEAEPEVAARVAAVCLPHDWLTWRLTGASSLTSLVTDRGDASGTGYWSPLGGAYRLDLLEQAFGRVLEVPEVLAPFALAGEARPGVAVSAGTGDNMGAALGLGAGPGDVIVSIGTSGVVSAVSATPAADPSGTVAGFADGTGAFLPLACTLNGAPVLASVASLLGCDLARLSDLALAAPPGAEGLVVVPYFSGERTPNLPEARGELVGMSLANTTPQNLARAVIEGLLCGLADGVDALAAQGVEVGRILLTGGGAQSPAVQEIAGRVFGVDVEVPAPGEHVALGAAWQAAVAHGGHRPDWARSTAARIPGRPVAEVRARYREAATRVAASTERPCARPQELVEPCRAVAPLPLGVGVEVLERRHVGDQRIVALARRQGRLGEIGDARRRQRLLHLGVLPERLGPFLQEQVGAHVGRGGRPHAVHRLRPVRLVVEVPGPVVGGSAVGAAVLEQVDQRERVEEVTVAEDEVLVELGAVLAVQVDVEELVVPERLRHRVGEVEVRHLLVADLGVHPHHRLVLEARDEGEGVADGRQEDVAPRLVGLRLQGEADPVAAVLDVLGEGVDRLSVTVERGAQVLGHVHLGTLPAPPEDVGGGAELGGQVEVAHHLPEGEAADLPVVGRERPLLEHRVGEQVGRHHRHDHPGPVEGLTEALQPPLALRGTGLERDDVVVVERDAVRPELGQGADHLHRVQRRPRRVAERVPGQPSDGPEPEAEPVLGPWCLCHGCSLPAVGTTVRRRARAGSGCRLLGP